MVGFRKSYISTRPAITTVRKQLAMSRLYATVSAPWRGAVSRWALALPLNASCATRPPEICSVVSARYCPALGVKGCERPCRCTGLSHMKEGTHMDALHASLRLLGVCLVITTLNIKAVSLIFAALQPVSYTHLTLPTTPYV